MLNEWIRSETVVRTFNSLVECVEVGNGRKVLQTLLL